MALNRLSVIFNNGWAKLVTYCGIVEPTFDIKRGLIHAVLTSLSRTLKGAFEISCGASGPTAEGWTFICCSFEGEDLKGLKVTAVDLPVKNIQSISIGNVGAASQEENAVT